MPHSFSATRAAAAFACLTLTTASAYAADPLTDSLSGHWHGSGLISRTYDASPEPGRCHAEITRQDESLRIAGDCAVGTGHSGFVVVAVPNGGQSVRAGVVAQGLAGTEQYAGTISDSQIKLATRAPVLIGDALYNGRLELELHDDARLDMRHWLWPEGSAAPRETVFVSLYRDDG